MALEGLAPPPINKGAQKEKKGKQGKSKQKERKGKKVGQINMTRWAPFKCKQGAVKGFREENFWDAKLKGGESNILQLCFRAPK